jgi:hypothetical protein
MKSASLQLQAALLALARAALAPVALTDGGLRNAIVPFASFDEMTTRRRDGLMATIEEHRLAIRIWSKAGGKAEAMTLADKVIAALDDAAPVMADHRVIRLYLDASDSRAAKDRIAVETTLKFVCLTEPLVEPPD